MGDSLILYRVINDDEYDELFKGIHREGIVNKYKISSKNNNTFNYSENINYMHFFKFAEHARERMSSFGNRLIMCDIPDNLIEQFGYGVYKHYDKENISVLIPEYIINRDNFRTAYIVKDRPKKRECIQYVNGVNKFTIYNQLLDSLYNEYAGHSDFNKSAFTNYALMFLIGNNIDNLIDGYLDSNDFKKMKIKERNSSEK